MAQEKVKKAFTGTAGSSIGSHGAEPGTSTTYSGIPVFARPKRAKTL
jgi:hypothetical protein